MSDTELEPCSYCGCDQIHLSKRGDWVIPYARYCRNCRAYGPHKKTEEEANAAWNTRTNAKLIEKIKDIAVSFFYEWYNSPGTNTNDGFDDWWAKNKARFISKELDNDK